MRGSECGDGQLAPTSQWQCTTALGAANGPQCHDLNPCIHPSNHDERRAISRSPHQLWHQASESTAKAGMALPARVGRKSIEAADNVVSRGIQSRCLVRMGSSSRLVKTAARETNAFQPAANLRFVVPSSEDEPNSTSTLTALPNRPAVGTHRNNAGKSWAQSCVSTTPDPENAVPQLQTRSEVM